MTGRTTLVSRKLATLILQGLPDDVPEERVTAHAKQAWRFHQMLEGLCKADLDQVDLAMVIFLLRGGGVQPIFPRFGVRDFRRITGKLEVSFVESIHPHISPATLWSNETGDRVELAFGPEHPIVDQQKALLYMVVSLHFGLVGIGAGNRFEDQVKEEVDRFYSANRELVEEVFSKLREAKQSQ